MVMINLLIHSQFYLDLYILICVFTTTVAKIHIEITYLFDRVRR